MPLSPRGDDSQSLLNNNYQNNINNSIILLQPGMANPLQSYLDFGPLLERQTSVDMQILREQLMRHGNLSP